MGIWVFCRLRGGAGTEDGRGWVEVWATCRSEGICVCDQEPRYGGPG